MLSILLCEPSPRPPHRHPIVPSHCPALISLSSSTSPLKHLAPHRSDRLVFEPPGFAPTCKASFPVLSPSFTSIRFVLYRSLMIIFPLSQDSKYPRDCPAPPFPPFSSRFSFHLLDSIASDTISRRTIPYFTSTLVPPRATNFSLWPFVSRFVLKCFGLGSGDVESLRLSLSSNSLCALEASAFSRRAFYSFPSQSTRTPNVSYRACQRSIPTSPLSILLDLGGTRGGFNSASAGTVSRLKDPDTCGQVG